MTLDALLDRIPDTARDLRLNLSSLASGTSLTSAQLHGAVYASAIAARNADLVRAARATAATELDVSLLEAAETAAALMGMNNVYYRFVHLVSDEEYGRLPARLRMQGLARHGAEKLDFELWSLAVSAIHGCGMCVDSHEQALRAAGATREQVQDAVRVASIVHGVAVALDARAALEADAA